MKIRYLALLLIFALLVVPNLTAIAQDDMEMATCEGEMLSDDSPVVKLGAAVSDTGKYANAGTDTHRGYELWLQWVNNEYGGINVDGVCHRAEIIFYDDESLTDTVSLLTERLITEDEVDILLGPYSSSLTMVASTIAEREGVIMVEGNGASEGIFNRGYENIFGVLTPAGNYTKSGIELAAANGAETAVIAYEDTAFPTSVAEGSKRWLEENGIELLAYESYPLDVADVTAMFTRFRELEPDIFVGGGHFNDAVLFITTAKEIGFNPGAFLITGVTLPTFVAEMGEDAEYVWSASQWQANLDYSDPWFGTAADYAARYEEMWEVAPSYQAAESTATALVTHLAIEAAGSLETDAIREALHEMDIITYYGPVNFDETGKNAGKPMVTIQVQDGEILMIAPEDAAEADVNWPAPLWDER